MTMARGVTEIDRLIEQGLGLYGEGDLDGALSLWERVLVIDPDNAQANSYVDYVRMNYDLLTGDNNTEDSGPFGIDNDDPEYQIEILPGDGVEPASAAPLYMDARDEGWVISDESDQQPTVLRLELELEIDADEPPRSSDSVQFENTQTRENVSFEDETREYPSGAGRPTVDLLGAARLPPESSPEFGVEITPPFGSIEDLRTPQDFGSQVTDVRRRDLGFVHPTGAHRPASEPPELKMTLRTPSPSIVPPIVPPIAAPAGGPAGAPTVPPSIASPVVRPALSPVVPMAATPAPAIRPAPITVVPSGTSELGAEADPHRAPTADGEPDDAASTSGTFELKLPAGSALEAAYAALDLDLGDPIARPTIDLVGRTATRPLPPAAPTLDLIGSLPTPRPPTSPTRPLPEPSRSPAGDGRDEDRRTREIEPTTNPLLSAARTTELPYTMQLDPLLAVHPDPQQPVALTRDFSEKPTARSGGPNRVDRVRSEGSEAPHQEGPPLAGGRVPPPRTDDLISMPTRNLGLRDARPATEDETTGEVDVHKIRAARQNGRPKPELPGIDPIDARGAEILEDVDRNAPVSETREDRTRRRITALLERATEWGRTAELERAVTAVDLALSEDPNSALAQKLIHRNRDTIMSAFQGFLGDLQRSPSLARPLHELGSAPISPRAAFLLSRVDGTLSLDEILDVSGMPRLEAYRYLCQLFLRGILR
jgi:hypothetical protein